MATLRLQYSIADIDLISSTNNDTTIPATLRVEELSSEATALHYHVPLLQLPWRCQRQPKVFDMI
jgi:hypothetical protein